MLVGHLCVDWGLLHICLNFRHHIFLIRINTSMHKCLDIMLIGHQCVEDSTIQYERCFSQMFQWNCTCIHVPTIFIKTSQSNNWSNFIQEFLRKFQQSGLSCRYRKSFQEQNLPWTYFYSWLFRNKSTIENNSRSLPLGIQILLFGSGNRKIFKLVVNT